MLIKGYIKEAILMKRLLLAIFITMCFISIVAGVTDSSTVTMTIKPRIVISDVADVNFDNVVPAQGHETVSLPFDIPITVQSNKDWQIDASGTDSGYMMSGSTSLGNPLRVKDKDGTIIELTSPVVVNSGTKPGTTFSTTFAQFFGWNDGPGDYQITLTFSATQI
jgi:hypothetical protein